MSLHAKAETQRRIEQVRARVRSLGHESEQLEEQWHATMAHVRLTQDALAEAKDHAKLVGQKEFSLEQVAEIQLKSRTLVDASLTLLRKRAQSEIEKEQAKLIPLRKKAKETREAAILHGVRTACLADPSCCSIEQEKAEAQNVASRRAQSDSTLASAEKSVRSLEEDVCSLRLSLTSAIDDLLEAAKSGTLEECERQRLLDTVQSLKEKI
eukprot:TRINITY_DN76747_c0_g1_i1.p1 TRINITY_DN76747_c0_g1~~TRINITY_DN76747_c0_g1_i1.p1  ORF type:complete len:224 (+),score=55.09 TRINITY_DN76747_c0_g1_i1:42-674(+)